MLTWLIARLTNRRDKREMKVRLFLRRPRRSGITSRKTIPRLKMISWRPKLPLKQLRIKKTRRQRKLQKILSQR